MKSKKPQPRDPGPESLKLAGGSWQDMMKKALEKKRPAGGWPEEAARKARPADQKPHK